MKSEIATFLGSVPYLSGISEATARRLSEASVVERLPSEAILSRANDKPGHLWFVSSGLVLSAILFPSGSSLVIDLSRPGEGIDEARVLGNERTSLQIKALVDSLLVGVPLGACREAILGCPENMEQFARRLDAKLQESHWMRSISNETAPHRVSHALKWLMGKLDRDLPVTRSGLGDIAGLSRETVIRVLSPLEKKGWIRTARGMIRIMRPDEVAKSLELQ